jgi:protein-disulfide isomerase
MRLALLALVAAAIAVLAGGWLSITADAPHAQVSEPLSTEVAELEPFEQRVRDYLLANPEVIMEALQILQERRRAAEADGLRRAIVERREELLNDPAAPVGGNPAGDVTLVEFFDYNCPYCRRVAPTVAGLIAADPGLRVVYKEFPILGPGSTFAARAALAARQQERYAPFHEAMMEAEGTLDERRVLEIARAAGIGLARLRQDMGDPAIEDAIARNLELAAALGITGTPSFVVGEQIVPGAVDRATLAALIAEVRRSQ